MHANGFFGRFGLLGALGTLRGALTPALSQRARGQEEACGLVSGSQRPSDRHLPPEERLRLADHLLASVSAGQDIEEAWAAEVDWRIAAVDAGQISLVPA